MAPTWRFNGPLQRSSGGSRQTPPGAKQDRAGHRGQSRLGPPGRAVENGDPAPVRVEEGGGFDLIATTLCNADPISTWKDETAGVAEHIIFHLAGDRA